jgi:hypothetical protein
MYLSALNTEQPKDITNFVKTEQKSTVYIVQMYLIILRKNNIIIAYQLIYNEIDIQYKLIIWQNKNH